LKHKKIKATAALLALCVAFAVLFCCTGCQGDAENKNEAIPAVQQNTVATLQDSDMIVIEEPVETFKLDVPAVRMEQDSFDCEISAITMMLQYAGADVTLEQMKEEMPYHESDPNQGFVLAEHVNVIYPPALMPLVNKYTNGRAKNMTACGYDELKNHIKKGFPVVVWAGDFHSLSDDEYSNAYYRSHTICLLGYDDYGLYYNDPYTGKEENITKDDFEFRWEYKDYMAISYE
jgi:uncharacterized protein YvpB